MFVKYLNLNFKYDSIILEDFKDFSLRFFPNNFSIKNVLFMDYFIECTVRLGLFKGVFVLCFLMAL